MLESIFILLLIVGILLLIISVEWESLALSGICIIIWLILALSVHQIEIPYQYINNDGVPVASTQSIETLFPLSLLFYGISIIMLIYMMVNLVFPMIGTKIKDRKML